VGGEVLEALKELGYAGASEEALTPDQRAARIAGWKKLHDWVRITEGDPMFGQIRNQDRFDLGNRPGEPVFFVQVDPETGAETFPGQAPVPYDRARILEFGLADTASNHIQLRKREFEREMTPSLYADLLAFAGECVDLRREAREALRVAEAMYAQAASFDPNDPLPLLGLARCYEAGFRLEQAWETYLGLLERFEHRPEVHVGLGKLEARLRLFESAEARLVQAERVGRASWEVQWALGRFLHERGRFEQAALHLREASRFEPKDPQATATSSLGAGPSRDGHSIYDVLIGATLFEMIIQSSNEPGLDLAPSSAALAGAQVELVDVPNRDLLLSSALEGVRERYDVVIIDCPPSLGILTVNALAAADSVLIPVQCEYLALEGLGQLVEIIQAVRERLNPRLELLGLLLTMHDGRTNLSAQVVEEVRRHFPRETFRSVVPRSIRLSEAPSYGQTIRSYDAACRGALAYAGLAQEVMERGYGPQGTGDREQGTGGPATRNPKREPRNSKDC
jgi:chromosome partitioning protein